MIFLLKYWKILAVTGAIIAVFLYGYSVGKNRATEKFNKQIIEAGKQDINVEQKQNAIRANRDNYDLSKRLRGASF